MQCEAHGHLLSGRNTSLLMRLKLHLEAIFTARMCAECASTSQLRAPTQAHVQNRMTTRIWSPRSETQGPRRCWQRQKSEDPRCTSLQALPRRGGWCNHQPHRRRHLHHPGVTQATSLPTVVGRPSARVASMCLEENFFVGPSSGERSRRLMGVCPRGDACDVKFRGVLNGVPAEISARMIKFRYMLNLVIKLVMR